MMYDKVVKNVERVKDLHVLENYLLEYMPERYCSIMDSMAKCKTILIDGTQGAQGKSTLVTLIRNTGYKGYVQDICEFDNYTVVKLDKRISKEERAKFKLNDGTPDVKKIKELWKEKFKQIYTRSSVELNDKVAELMDNYTRLVEKAKSFGLDIRLYADSPTLVLYYNDDYPDTLLVDKSNGI